MKIRRAQPGDGAELAVLSGQLGYEAEPAYLEERVARAEGSRTEAIIVAQLEAGKLAGFAGVAENPCFFARGTAELTGLVVEESLRGTGIGGALVAAAEGWARERGYATMRVKSNVKREGAHRFYERHGYRNVKGQYTFVKELPARGGNGK